jgi:hypothetical protein
MLTSLSRVLTLYVLLAPSTVFADTLHVDADLATGLNDGSSWADAYQGPLGLQAALATAVSGDRIFVAGGWYAPALTGDRSASFVLQNGVELYGGCQGDETDPSERPLGASPSILSGDQFQDGGFPTAPDDNSYHVVVASAGTDATAVLDRFLIENGAAEGTYPDSAGGGLLALDAGPTVRGCFFRRHRADSSGGACYVLGGAPIFTDCVFVLSEAHFGGGGISIGQSVGIRIERCRFRRNTVTWALFPDGAAVDIWAESDVTITESLFWDNLAGRGGGIVSSDDSTVSFRGNTVVGNRADGHRNAGLQDEGAGVTVANCLFWDNEGDDPQGPASHITGAAASYCLIEGGFPGVGNISAAPQFNDPGAGGFRLEPGSPGIDAGHNALVTPGSTTDTTGAPRFSDDPQTPDTGIGSTPIVDMGAYETQGPAYLSFCDDTDGSLASCPCGNPGAPDTGCDVKQATGGVGLDVLLQETEPQNRVTLVGSGFKLSATPTAIVLRAPGLDPNAPVVFGDGLRCVGVPLVRLAATFSVTGISNHTLGHGAMSGDWYYQLWFRNTLAAFCTPDAFNLSNGRVITW